MSSKFAALLAAVVLVLSAGTEPVQAAVPVDPRADLGAALGAGLGADPRAVPSAARDGAVPRAAGTTARRKPFEIVAVSPRSWCCIFGYTWGWHYLEVSADGERRGRSYALVINGRRVTKAKGVPGSGAAFVSLGIDRRDYRLRPGTTYRLRIREYRRDRLVRATPPKRFTVPERVGAPAAASLDALSMDGEAVVVAGRTHAISYDGEWDEGLTFTGGVERFYGEDRWGDYAYPDHPHPWQQHAAAPITELAVAEDRAGDYLYVVSVGSRPELEVRYQRPGAAGFLWYVRVVSEEELAAASSVAPLQIDGRTGRRRQGPVVAYDPL